MLVTQHYCLSQMFYASEMITYSFYPYVASTWKSTTSPLAIEISDVIVILETYSSKKTDFDLYSIIINKIMHESHHIPTSITRLKQFPFYKRVFFSVVERIFLSNAMKAAYVLFVPQRHSFPAQPKYMPALWYSLFLFLTGSTLSSCITFTCMAELKLSL